MKKITGLLFLLMSTLAIAQPSGTDITYSNVRSGDRFVSDGNTTGTPYHHDQYHKGSIYLNNTLAASSLYLKYNAYRDIFLASMDPNASDDQAQVVTKANGMKILVNNEEFIALPSVDNRYDIQHYQVVVRGNKMTLLKKIGKLFKEGSRATTHLTRDVPSTYSDRFDFYLRDEAGDFIKVPSSTKKVLDLFPKDRKALASAVKKYRLNLKKEIDLIRFIGYYNRM
ncbi:MAG: hypothetical protein ACPG59_00700 [Flavobacteriaceae bacterium]|jgi:hypothetical protein